MQFWVSLFFAACIWFVVRYIVLQVKQNESGTSSSKTRIKRKARSKIYENLHKLSEYLDDESYPKTAVPWKAFVKQFGNSELKNDIDFDGRPAKLLKLFENVFEIIKTERTYLAQLKQLLDASTDATLGGKLSLYDRRRLFTKIAEIYKLNDELFQTFCDEFDADFTMLNIFDNLQQFLSNQSVRDFYVEYNRFHEERNQLVISFSKRPDIPSYPWQSLTIAPVQRVTRYSLLLQSILSHFPQNDHPDYDSIAIIFDHDTIQATLDAATDFAECCNKALDNEVKLMNLAQLKNQIDTEILAVKDFVSRGRRIISELPVKLYRVKVDDSFGSALHNFSASVMKVKKVRLILLSDMLMLLVETKHKKKWSILDQDLLTSIDITFLKNEQPLSPKISNHSDKRSFGDGDSTRLNSSNPSSSESDEKQSTDSTGSLVGCDPRMKIAFRTTGRHFALMFSNEEQEDSFLMAFNWHRTQQYDL